MDIVTYRMTWLSLILIVIRRSIYVLFILGYTRNCENWEPVKTSPWKHDALSASLLLRVVRNCYLFIEQETSRKRFGSFVWMCKSHWWKFIELENCRMSYLENRRGSPPVKDDLSFLGNGDRIRRNLELTLDDLVGACRHTVISLLLHPTPFSIRLLAVCLHACCSIFELFRFAEAKCFDVWLIMNKIT